ncbi:FAD-binding protein [Cupriavidus necator]
MTGPRFPHTASATACEVSSDSAVVERDGKKVSVKARHGVVLASGGFPHNLERRKQTYPHVKAGHGHYSPTPQTNVGAW